MERVRVYVPLETMDIINEMADGDSVFVQEVVDMALLRGIRAINQALVFSGHEERGLGYLERIHRIGAALSAEITARHSGEVVGGSDTP
jgi:hypothetical protein